MYVHGEGGSASIGCEPVLASAFPPFFPCMMDRLFSSSCPIILFLCTVVGTWEHENVSPWTIIFCLVSLLREMKLCEMEGIFLVFLSEHQGLVAWGGFDRKTFYRFFFLEIATISCAFSRNELTNRLSTTSRKCTHWMSNRSDRGNSRLPCAYNYHTAGFTTGEEWRRYHMYVC